MIFLFRVEVLKEQNLKHNKIYIDVLKKTNTNDKNIQDYKIYIYIKTAELKMKFKTALKVTCVRSHLTDTTVISEHQTLIFPSSSWTSIVHLRENPFTYLFYPFQHWCVIKYLSILLVYLWAVHE